MAFGVHGSPLAHHWSRHPVDLLHLFGNQRERKPPMELTSLIRKAITIGTWILVYYLFVPKAKRKGRSGFKWFLIGALAMWGTFVGFVGIAVVINLSLPMSINPDGSVTADAIDRQIAFFPIGFCLGYTVMFAMSRYLGRLPAIEPAAPVKTEGV